MGTALAPSAGSLSTSRHYYCRRYLLTKAWAGNSTLRILVSTLSNEKKRHFVHVMVLFTLANEE